MIKKNHEIKFNFCKFINYYELTKGKININIFNNAIYENIISLESLKLKVTAL